MGGISAFGRLFFSTTDVAIFSRTRYSFVNLPQREIQMSDYVKLKENGMGRGRPRHTDEQRAQAKALNAVRQEARRRAHLVLKSKHEDEFAAICEQEMKTLLADDGTARRAKKKSTRKSA